MADILVIDGDARYRTSIAQTLADKGHQVRQAEDGTQGLALCRRMRPALMITAIVMPEMDGIELIRSLSREMPDLPILAISGAVNALLYLRIATALGAAAALRKPFSADELLLAAATLLDGGNRLHNHRSRSHR
jgi:two-component system nitrogen regulation response regulator NtrX